MCDSTAKQMKYKSIAERDHMILPYYLAAG